MADSSLTNNFFQVFPENLCTSPSNDNNGLIDVQKLSHCNSNDVSIENLKAALKESSSNDSLRAFDNARESYFWFDMANEILRETISKMKEGKLKMNKVQFKDFKRTFKMSFDKARKFLLNGVNKISESEMQTYLAICEEQEQMISVLAKFKVQKPTPKHKISMKKAEEKQQNRQIDTFNFSDLDESINISPKTQPSTIQSDLFTHAQLMVQSSGNTIKTSSVCQEEIIISPTFSNCSPQMPSQEYLEKRELNPEYYYGQQEEACPPQNVKKVKTETINYEEYAEMNAQKKTFSSSNSEMPNPFDSFLDYTAVQADAHLEFY